MNDPTSPLAIKACDLVKRYEEGRVVALNSLSVQVETGEFVAVCGPSGCGKSTLLNLLAAIDQPDSGTIDVGGRNIGRMTANQADVFRSSTVGLVFQLHNLLPGLTALENIQVPMLATTSDPELRVKRAVFLLGQVGLGDRMHALPTVLSGGERQRVAVARALANRPLVLLADEPTGSLDSRTGESLIDLLCEMRREFGMTLVVVTHEDAVALRAERIIHMLDGEIVPQPLAASRQ